MWEERAPFSLLQEYLRITSVEEVIGKKRKEGNKEKKSKGTCVEEKKRGKKKKKKIWIKK